MSEATNTHALSEYARKGQGQGGWSGRTIHGTRGKPPVSPDTSENAKVQRKAAQKLTECEALTGFSVEELDAWHAEQRARVFRRYGLTA